MKPMNFTKYLLLLTLLHYAVEASAQCPKAPTCEDLGYKMNKAQCSGKKYIKCPMDFNKVFCNGGLIGEIKPYSGTTVPNGWLKADGRSLSSSKYPQLYTIIGNTYGGSGSTFYLPNLSRKMVCGASANAYSGNKPGTTGGAEKVTLTLSELPSHSHAYTGVYGIGWPKKPSDSTEVGSPRAYPRQTQLGDRGGGAAHNNMPPYLYLDYIIYTGVHEGD